MLNKIAIACHRAHLLTMKLRFLPQNLISINIGVHVLSTLHRNANLYDSILEQLNNYFKVKFSFSSDKTIFGNLLIYFKEKQFITSKRSELYGLTEFMGKTFRFKIGKQIEYIPIIGLANLLYRNCRNSSP